MSETAPERIMLQRTCGGGWSNVTTEYGTEYVRADIHDISQTERHADGEYIGHLQARVEELEAALPQWRDISSAPKDGRGLLGYWPHWTAFPVRIWWQDNQWHMAEDHPAEWHDDMPLEHGPLAWMPLPLTPPEQQ